MENPYLEKGTLVKRKVRIKTSEVADDCTGVTDEQTSKNLRNRGLSKVS